MEEVPGHNNSGDERDQPRHDDVTKLGINGLKNRAHDSGAPDIEDAINSIEKSLQTSAGDQSLSLSDSVIGQRYISKTETYAIGLSSVERHMGKDAAEEIRGELERIDAMQPNTIVELRDRGELDSKTDSAVRRLSIFGVNSDHLTPSEVNSVVSFAADATPEIVETKIGTIYDAFMRHFQGANNRRDGLNPAYYDASEAARKVALQDKYKAYVDGKLDLERGFDVNAVYTRLVDDGYEASSSLKRHLEEDDLEDLQDEGLVDDSDLYVYGPFTEADLANIEGDLSKSWTSIARPRFNGGLKKIGKRRIAASEARGVEQPAYVLHSGSSLAQLMDETIPAKPTNLEQDLIYGFVAGEILQDRRLNSKHTLIASAALALDVIELAPPDKPGKKDDDGDWYELAKIEYDSVRKATSWLSYYAAELLGYSRNEMQERFGGSSRPISKEFFKEVIDSTRAIPESRFEYMDKYFKQTLTKMDEHMCDIMYGLTFLNHSTTGAQQQDQVPFNNWQTEEDFD